MPNPSRLKSERPLTLIVRIPAASKLESHDLRKLYLDRIIRRPNCSDMKILGLAAHYLLRSPTSILSINKSFGYGCVGRLAPAKGRLRSVLSFSPT